MKIPISRSHFLTDYWQKAPLFMPAAGDDVEPALTADELAWLAMQPDVESRLVFTEHAGNRMRYRLENGPFTEDELKNLPPEDWTLLVQDVEKHLPALHSILHHADVVPEWRVDDLMISFAAPGGSVGPHRDSYDVFLCQVSGCREWLLGDPRKALPDTDNDRLSLLRPFAPIATHLSAPGDVLYLPPDVPHWGVAQDSCMTCSIGMRAPTDAELRAGAARLFGTDADDRASASLPVRFYRDSDLQPDEVDGCRIAQRAVRRVREQGLLDPNSSDAEVATVFGAVVTDPKAWLMPEVAGEATARKFIDSAQRLRIHGMARIAWFEDADIRLVFVNGNATVMPAGAAAFVRELCETRCIDGAGLRGWRTLPDGRELLYWMAREGLFDLDADGR